MEGRLGPWIQWRAKNFWLDISFALHWKFDKRILPLSAIDVETYATITGDHTD